MSFKKIAVNTTYLELYKKSSKPTPALPGVVIERKDNLAPAQYLEMYKKIGGPWGWASRLVIDEKTLKSIIHDKNVYIYTIMRDEQILGFCELDARKKPDIEVVYLGILSSAIGQGLGHQLLKFACNQAFNLGNRIWLHTCEHDHPSAIEFYTKMGFKIFDRRVDEEIYSSDFLSRETAIT